MTRPSDEWRVSVDHFLNVWGDSTIFVLEVPRGILINDVADEGVDGGLFGFGAVAGVHEANCDATLVVGFFGVIVFLAVFVEKDHVGEGSGFDVARELLHVIDRVTHPKTLAVVITSVDDVRRLVGAAVAHFDAEGEFVALVGDVVVAAVRVSEDAALAAVAREETMSDRVLLAAVDEWESVAVKVARDSAVLRPSVRNRLMGDDRTKVLSAFASRADVSDAELALLVSRSQSVARSVALRGAPLSEGALLAVVNALDDVSPVLSRADVTPRVLAVACERVDADGARRVARRGNVDSAVGAGLARNPWTSVRAIAAGLPDLPESLVDALADDGDEEVREAVAARADLSRDVARQLWEAALPGSRTRELLSKNERVQAAWMVDKAGDMRTYELTNFVTRGGEGVDALCEAAARECGEETRTWLASWTGTPEVAARVLAGDRVWSVRRALADNVSVPADVLDALAQDADGRVSDRAELSQAYVRAVRDHNGDDAALYQVKAERGARERFGSNYSEIPNSSHRRGASRGWADSRDSEGEVAPANKPIVFMSRGEMVEAASRHRLNDKDQKKLVVFGGERVHMALVMRADLCEDAQKALVVHGGERVQVALARRGGVLGERVQVALAVQGGPAARSALSRRFDLCDHARRLVS